MRISWLMLAMNALFRRSASSLRRVFSTSSAPLPLQLFPLRAQLLALRRSRSLCAMSSRFSVASRSRPASARGRAR